MLQYATYILRILCVVMVAIVLTITPLEGRAQDKFNSVVDSLIKLALNAPDSLAAQYNNDVCWKLRNISPEIAIQYGMKALEKATETQDKLQLVKAHAYLGVCQRNLDNFDEAQKYYDLGIKYAKMYDVKDQLGYGYVNLGNLLIYREKFKEAEENLLRAKPIAEQLGDSGILGYVYLNLGRVWLGLKDYKKSEENFNKSIEIRTKCKKLNKQVCIPCKYLADCHAEAGQTDRALNEYIATLKQADYISDYDILGEVAYRVAKIYYEKKHQYDSTLQYANESLKYARNIGSKKAITEAYDLMTDIYKAKKDYKSLSDCYIRQIECYDSLLKKQVEQQSYNIRYSADAYKRQTEIASLNDENRWRWHINVMSLIILVVAALAVTLIIINIRKVKSLNKMIEARNAKLESANYEITSSINYARRIQKSALSTIESITNIFPDSMVYYMPKEIVAGDWYRVETLKGHIIIAEGDCTGTGVPGSLLTMMGISIFKDTVNAFLKDNAPMKASAMLDKMRQQVKKMFNSNDDDTEFDGGMDASIAVIDPQTRRLSFAAASQTALLLRDGVVTQLKGDSMRVGKFIRETDFTEQDVQLQRGDTLYIMNNGIRDLKNPDGERFICGRLEQFLIENNEKPMTEIGSLLHDEIHAWCQSSECDDITAIGIRVE